MSVKLDLTNSADLFNGSSTSLLLIIVITIMKRIIEIDSLWLCFVWWFLL